MLLRRRNGCWDRVAKNNCLAAETAEAWERVDRFPSPHHSLYLRGQVRGLGFSLHLRLFRSTLLATLYDPSRRWRLLHTITLSAGKYPSSRTHWSLILFAPRNYAGFPAMRCNLLGNAGPDVQTSTAREHSRAGSQHIRSQ